MLKVENISLKIQGRDILSNVSFEAMPGEVVVILGANGAGKSTLLKVISGEHKQDKGSVSYESLQRVEAKGLFTKLTRSFRTPHSSFELSRHRAVLSQSTALNLPFIVEEVVLMGRYPHFHGDPTTLDLQIVNDAIEQAGISKLKGRVYTTLSGGEQQRVHLARVMAQIAEQPAATGNPYKQTKYLFLDEPTSSLDLKHQHQTLQLAVEAAANGAVVLAVLHDLNLAAMYADKLLMLKNGETVAWGKTEEVLQEKYIFEGYGIPVKVIKHDDCKHPIVMPAVAISPGINEVKMTVA